MKYLTLRPFESGWAITKTAAARTTDAHMAAIDDALIDPMWPIPDAEWESLPAHTSLRLRVGIKGVGLVHILSEGDDAMYAQIATAIDALAPGRYPVYKDPTGHLIDDGWLHATGEAAA